MKKLARYRKTRLSIILAALLLLWTDPNTVLTAQPKQSLEDEAADSILEARGALGQLVSESVSLLPKLLLVTATVLIAWLLFFLFRSLYKRLQMNRQRQEGVVILVRLLLIFVALIVSVTILAGDIGTLLGSLGLIGLALSWALQQPIESFSGYLLNAFRSYYRIGDRIHLGAIHGDVYRIDFLTTTVWEVGGPGKSVTGAQPTGALVTFPNSEVLRSSIVNDSRDFPYIWDEVTVGIANESDLVYTAEVFRKLAEKLIGSSMRESAQAYQFLLKTRGIDYEVETSPQVYFSAASSWTDCTLRYLVALRERRRWSSLIFEKLSTEMSQATHKGKIISAYPKSIVAKEST